MLESISKSNNIQRIILIGTLISDILVVVLTWYCVIYQRTATESSAWTRFFILHFGAFGLVISFLIFFGTFFMCWFGWIYLSKERKPKHSHKWALSIFVGIATILFVLAIFDFVNDLLVFGLKSSILLPFLNPPWLIVPIFIAFSLAVGLLYSKLFSF